jgi:hypothetical protein
MPRFFGKQRQVEKNQGKGEGVLAAKIFFQKKVDPENKMQENFQKYFR